MNALNSFSVVRDLHFYSPEFIEVEQFDRTLSEKGIFIIPYDTSRLVAFVRCEIDVLDATNESRTLWSNPELSFYGYCHIRSFKQSLGNPVQINQRNQVLFQWFPLENVASINGSQVFNNLLGAISATLTEPVKVQLAGPLVTDFSFGFQKYGKFFVVVTIGYFNPAALPAAGVAEFLQPIPNPLDTETTDPSSYKDLGYPDVPVSPPYTEENNDYGESVGGPPLPEEPPAQVPFRIRFSYSGPGADPSPQLTVQYSGPQPTSINTQPVKRGDGYFATIQTASGTFYLPYVGAFATQAQEDAFLETFEFIEFVYD